MSSLPDDVSDTILNNAGSYGGSILTADFCPYVQVLCVYMYTVGLWHFTQYHQRS